MAVDVPMTIVMPTGQVVPSAACRKCLTRLTTGPSIRQTATQHRSFWPLQIYYFSDAQTTYTTYPNGVETVQFPNKHIGEWCLPELAWLSGFCAHVLYKVLWKH